MAKTIKWSAMVQKARENSAFKQELLSNPRSAIEKASGILLPEGVDYVVHEQTAQSVHLVLPMDTIGDPAALAVYTEGDDPEAVYTEGDDAVYTEGDDNAVYTEGDDGVYTEGDEAVYTEGDDAVYTDGDDAVYTEGDEEPPKG